MTRYAFVDDVFTNTAIEATGEFVGPDGRQYPRNWLDLTTPQEKAAIGLKAIAEAGAVPDGKRAVGRELSVSNGSPVEAWVLEDIPIGEILAAKLAAIDAERDRRQQLDFTYDFGATTAIDDTGVEIEAGERALQMRLVPDQSNWAVLNGQALAAVVSGAPETVMPMRAEDNWNIQTTAAQVLTVCAAMVTRNAAELFAGGAIKTAARAAHDAADRAALMAIDPLSGWPQ